MLVLVVGAVLAVSGAAPDGPFAQFLPPIVALIVYFGYFAALERRGTLDRLTRGTLGKAAFKLAVETEGGAPLPLHRVILRQGAKLLLSALFPLALFTPMGRAPHDWAVGSRVVRKLARPRPT